MENILQHSINKSSYYGLFIFYKEVNLTFFIKFNLLIVNFIV